MKKININVLLVGISAQRKANTIKGKEERMEGKRRKAVEEMQVYRVD